jgi:hypothetical protein
VSVCDEIRPELPAYVAGDLDELKRNVVAGHLEVCADCKREVEEIRELTSLLSTAAVEHKPPEDLEAQVFGFVEHNPEMELVASAPLEHTPPDDLERKSLERVGVLRRNDWFDRYGRRIAPLLTAASLVFFAMGFNWRGDAQGAQHQVQSLEGHYGEWGHSMGIVDLGMTGSISNAEVSARLVEFQQDNYRVVLYTDGLPPTPEGYVYEIWLVGDQGRISCGSFKVENYAHLSFPFTVGVNPTDYPELEVTLEPIDGEPGQAGDVVMRAQLAGVDKP